MDGLKEVIQIAFAVSLFMLVLDVGLDAEWEDFLYLFKRPRRLLRAVLAVNLVVPVAAILLLGIFDISRVAAAGVLFMAISPVPPLVPGKELKIGAHRSYAYGVYVALVLLAILVVPLWVLALDALYGVRISLPPGSIVRNVALTVLLPLLLGLVVQRLAPGVAHRLGGVLGKLAMLLLLLAVVPVLVGAWSAMIGLVGDGTVVVMALVGVVSLLAGHALGGPEPEGRAALAVTAATRHPGIAMMLAGANTQDERVTAAILGFLIVGTVVGVPYQLWTRRRAHAADGARSSTSAP